LTARLIPDLSIDVSELGLDEPVADAGTSTSFDEFDSSIGSDAFEDPPAASGDVQLTESTLLADTSEHAASLSDPESAPSASIEDPNPPERWTPHDPVSSPELPEPMIATPESIRPPSPLEPVPMAAPAHDPVSVPSVSQ